jgi:acyl-CoA synthetase (AMP-forming)/AMP-acid ligase II/acyl carrier protein
LTTARRPGPATLEELVEIGAGASADGSAIVAPDGGTRSYSDLLAEMRGLRGRLRAAGVRRDDAVAVVLPNDPAMAVAFLGVACAAAAAPLNPASREAELQASFDDLRPAALVTDGCSPESEAVAHARGIPIMAPLGAVATPVGGDDRPAADDVALLLHTSGTTSKPKRVPLTHANLCTSAANVAATLALEPADRCLNVMPLFHIHGLVAALLASLHAGGSVVCAPGFEHERFLPTARSRGCTWYTAVPTIHQAVLAVARAAAPGDRPRFRFARSSSAALPPTVAAELEAVLDAPVIEAYGMTEAAHQMASNPLPPRPRKPGSVGPAAGPDVAVMDAAGALLPVGAAGEIVIRGPSVTRGYLDNPEANASAFTDGWFRTGDQGALDADGYLTITGRLKEMINRGGEKITPREIDEALLDHAAVAQAVAFAVPHPTLGEDVAAAVVLRDGETADVDELRAFVGERLAAHKVPRRVVVLDELPKGPTGKLQRIGLADRLGLTAVGEGPRAIYADAREAAVAALWAHVLGRASVGPDDDFVELGGDSLLAVLLVSDVREVFGVELAESAPFDEAPTVAAMAALIAGLGRVGT